MNRIVLKINFLENNGLKIDLFHLDKRFLSGKEEFNQFYDSAFEFMIYSRRKLSISANTLRLPDKNNYKDSQSVTHNFASEDERYKFLKGLYRCLTEWNDRYTSFTKDSEHIKRNKKMITSGEFWVI